MEIILGEQTQKPKVPTDARRQRTILIRHSVCLLAAGVPHSDQQRGHKARLAL